MEQIDFAFFIVLIGCGYCSYLIGKREGIGITLEYMREQGKIDYED